MIINIPSSKSSGFINSTNEPSGVYQNGTVWYNPDTKEFKTYVVGTGFVSPVSPMGFIRDESVYVVPETIDIPQNITIPIGIEDFNTGYTLEVIYEGLVLTLGTHYTIDYDNKTITLLNFTVLEGEQITFSVTRIVEASNVTEATTMITSHINGTGSGTMKSHVGLSDAIDSLSDVNGGIAATPKAVYNSRIMTDTVTGSKYRFGVENGMLYIEEV